MYFLFRRNREYKKPWLTRKISTLSKLCLIATVNLCFLGRGGAIYIVTLKPQQSHFLLGLISTIRSVSPCSVVMPLYDVYKSLSTTKRQEKHSYHIDITFSIYRIFFALHWRNKKFAYMWFYKMEIVDNIISSNTKYDFLSSGKCIGNPLR